VQGAWDERRREQGPDQQRTAANGLGHSVLPRRS
jgi:hypothetical protein